MTDGLSRRDLLMGLVVVALTLGGSLTITDRYPLGLVWPSAGVATAWLLTQQTRRGLALVSGLTAAVAVLFLAVTGTSWVLCLALTGALTVQAGSVTFLVRRWCPHLMASDGNLDVDLRTRGSVVLAALVGTTVATVPVALGTRAVGLPLADVLAWWGAAFSGLVVVGAIVHLGWERRRTHASTGLNVGRVEVLALWAVTAAIVLRMDLSQNASSFLVIVPAVWAGLRLPTLHAVTHICVTGGVAAVITLVGHGPFAAIDDPQVAALTFQGFLMLMVLTTLTIGTSRDERAAAYARVSASAEVFDAMTGAMTEGIVVLGRDGRVQRLNSSAMELLGTLEQDDALHSMRARSMSGKPLPPEEQPTRRAMTTGEVVREEVILTVADGGERVVVVTAAPLTATAKGPDAPGAVVVYRDVTEERRRAEVLAAMHEAMTEGLIVVDHEGRFVEHNGASRRLLAQTTAAGSENIYDYPLMRLDGTPLPPEEHPSVRARVERRAVTQDVVLPLADGGQRILAITAAPLTGGFGSDVDPGVLKVYRDVTDERQESRHLAEFAGNVAHDLRSPLTAAAGWLDLAEEYPDDHDAVVNAVGRAQGGVHRMAVLIEELLAQATADGGELKLEPVGLGGPHGLVAELAEVVDPNGEATITTGNVPLVMADPDMLSQLISNLLSNALKYVEPGTTPQVCVVGRSQGKRVLVEVSDNGIGIPDEQRALIFDRFHRAHADDDRYSGTGLGLAICRTIVERHGGTITAVCGAEGIGTTFRFDLSAVEL